MFEMIKEDRIPHLLENSSGLQKAFAAAAAGGVLAGTVAVGTLAIGAVASPAIAAVALVGTAAVGTGAALKTFEKVLSR